MRKISILLASLLATAFLFVGTGCDGVKDAVVGETGDTWYKWNGTGKTVTSTDSSFTSTDTYFYYDTSEGNLRVVATANSLYVEYDKSYSAGAWIGTVIPAIQQGKFTRQSSDPTSGKTELDKDTNLSALAADKIVSWLLGTN